MKRGGQGRSEENWNSGVCYPSLFFPTCRCSLKTIYVDTQAVSERVCVGFHSLLILASFNSLSLHTGGRWHGVRKGSFVSKQTLCSSPADIDLCQENPSC